MCLHMVTYVHATWRTCRRVYAYVCMYAYVYICVISELSIIFRIFSNSLITHTLYTRQFILIFAKWDYLCLFLCASYVTKCRACDGVNQTVIVDLHLSEGVRSVL